MVNMQIQVDGKVVDIPAQDGVRVSQESVNTMVDHMFREIQKDRARIRRRLMNIDAIEQRFITTGDVMLKAIVSRSWSGREGELSVELYVCKIERFARVEI
jgi:hypothetical protein